MDVRKLAKVLALAASDNDAEALHALRTARRLLDIHGMDFVELAGRLAASPETDDAVLESLENTIFDLRAEVRRLRADNERLQKVSSEARPAPVRRPTGRAKAGPGQYPLF